MVCIIYAASITADSGIVVPAVFTCRAAFTGCVSENGAIIQGQPSGVQNSSAGAARRGRAPARAPAAVRCVARGQRQAGNHHFGAGCNVEYTIGVVAADGESVLARAGDFQIIGDKQFTVPENNGPIYGESNPSSRCGISNSLTQRA